MTVEQTKPDSKLGVPPVDGQRPAVAGPRVAETPQSGQRPRRGVPPAIVFLVLAAFVIGGGFYAYQYLIDQQLYVSTDNAAVTGSLLQVGSLNAGRVGSVSVDIGDQVRRDQVVASVILPSVLSTSGSGTAKLGFRGSDDQTVSVQAPIDGVVVARSANPGDTIAAGQPIITVVDPNRLWVQALVEETRVSRVRPGQFAEVTLDSIGRVLPGRVTAVGSATAATFSLLPQGNTSGNYTRVTQLVPVRLAVDYGTTPPILGSSVTVKIRVQD